MPIVYTLNELFYLIRVNENSDETFYHKRI